MYHNTNASSIMVNIENGFPTIDTRLTIKPIIESTITVILPQGLPENNAPAIINSITASLLFSNYLLKKK